jgi:transposase
MDNCSVHRSKELLNYYRKRKVNVLTFPAYCPNMNVVEYAFSIIKKKFYQSVFKSR